MAVFVLAICSPSFAQGAASNPHRQLVVDFFALMGIDKQMETMLEQMQAMQKQVIMQGKNPEEAMKVQDKVYKVLSESMTWDKVKDKYIDLYESAFSEDDLKAMIAFYKGPTGQKILNTMPDLMKKGMVIGQDLMKDVQPKLDAIMAESTPAPASSMPAAPAAGAPAAK